MQTISKDRVHDVPIIFIFQQKYSTFTAFVMVNKLVDVPPAVAPLSAKSLRNFFKSIPALCTVTIQIRRA